MKKTLTANIGGTVFNIEEDAYDRLQRYLGSIRGQFAGSESAAEIMADIEARIAELFQQRMGEERQVVNLADVEHVIGVMGQPEDYLGEEETGGTGSASAATGRRKAYRRLYRDPDDKWVGGVLSGVSHFFGIDPLILRLVYIILLLVGVGWLIYIILWIVVPPAETAAEKLEMRGEPVNVDNIKRVFEEGADRFKKGAERAYAEGSEQFKQGAERVKNEARDMGRRFDGSAAREGVHGFFGFLGEMIRLLIRSIGRLIGVFLLLFGAVAAVVLAIVIIGRSDLLFADDAHAHLLGAGEWSDLIFMTHGQGNWAWAAGVVFILVPVIGLLYGGISLLFDVKGPKWMGWALGPIWIVSIVVLTIVGIRVASDLRVPEEMGSEQVIQQPASGHLTLMRTDARSDAFSWKARYKNGRIQMSSELDVDGDSVRWNDAEVDVQRSPDSLFHLLVFRSARGTTSKVARSRAADITPQWMQTDTILGLSSAYRSPRSGKLRMQQVRYLVLVPLGGSVTLDESLGNMPDDIKNVSDTWDWEMLGRTWTMTARGLEDLAMPKEDKRVEEEEEEEAPAAKGDETSAVAPIPAFDLLAAEPFRGLPKRANVPVDEEEAADAERAPSFSFGLLDLLGRAIRL